MRNKLLFAVATLLLVSTGAWAQVNTGIARKTPRYATPPTCSASLKSFLYYDTDDNEAYFCNGTSWVKFRDGAGTGTPGGASGDVQTNDGAGGFGGSSALNFNGTTLTVTGVVDASTKVTSAFFAPRSGTVASTGILRLVNNTNGVCWDAAGAGDVCLIVNGSDVLGVSAGNLNATQLGGATFAAPGTIGGTTPGLITGTTITATANFAGDIVGNVTGNASGTAATITGALALANTPLTTRGDIMVANVTPALARLAKGTQYTVLQAGANDPAYDAVHLDQAAAVTGVLPPANWSPLTTNGDLVYHNGTTTVRLARGANGECLTSNATTILWGSCATGLANTALSNLASVAINTTLVSDTDNTDDLGSATVGWKSIYAATSIQVGGATAADAGDIRLKNAATIQWEASPAGTNCSLSVNSSEQFTTDCPWSVTGTSAGSIALQEPSGTGTDTVTLAAPASVTTSYTLTFPAATANGIMRVNTGAITFDADISHLATSTSANLRGVLSDELGTGAALFNSAPNPTLVDVTVDDVLTFAESAGDSTCGAGDYWLKGNSTSGKVRGCENGTLFDANTVAGAASWSGLSAPTSAISMLSDGVAETVTFDFQAAFTTGSQFIIKSSTGNPTGGTLVEVLGHDADVQLLKVTNGGTNGIAVSAAGALAATGTGSINATLFKGNATVAVADGGTGLTSGTSGGVLAYTAAGTLASSGALTANAIVLGGGAGVVPTVLGSLGTTTTVLHGNAGGAPTFGAVVSGDITDGTIAVADVAATLKTGMKDVTLDAPVTGDSNKVQWYFPSAITITRVVCSVGAATSVTIQLDERAEATPNTAGTDVMTSTLVCDTDSQVTTTFTNATIAARVPLNLQITAVSGTPGSVRVHIEYTID